MEELGTNLKRAFSLFFRKHHRQRGKQNKQEYGRRKKDRQGIVYFAIHSQWQSQFSNTREILFAGAFRVQAEGTQRKLLHGAIPHKSSKSKPNTSTGVIPPKQRSKSTEVKDPKRSTTSIGTIPQEQAQFKVCAFVLLVLC